MARNAKNIQKGISHIMNQAFEITSDDVANVLNLPCDDPRVEICFNSLDDEDFARIESDALCGDDMDEQTNYAYTSIREILSEKGFYTTGEKYERGTLVRDKAFMNPESQGK
jgi:hypothetical protein